jgi:hypothetical protein
LSLEGVYFPASPVVPVVLVVAEDAPAAGSSFLAHPPKARSDPTTRIPSMIVLIVFIVFPI